MAALQKMGAYLRGLSAFRVQGVTTDEDVVEDGQKIQYSESVDILASTPSHLRAEVLSDRKERILYYDGKTLSMFAPRVGYYASIAAPPTITQLDKLLVNEYDFSIPLRDLFVWGSAGWNSGSIENLIDVGPSQVNGTTCEQYAVRCTSVIVNGLAYQQCGSTWYQPQISGSSTTYVVVNPPR